MEGGCQNNTTFPVEYSRVGSTFQGGEPSEGMVEARSAALLGCRRGPRGRSAGHRRRGVIARRRNVARSGSLCAHRLGVNGGEGLGARPADDAMYNKIKGLLQTQATLCRFLF